MTEQTEGVEVAALATALLRMADGYAERGGSVFTGADVADDLRSLASTVDPPEPNPMHEKALRRAARVVALVGCPTCGRGRGEPCANLVTTLDEAPRDRVFPHRERDRAARAAAGGGS